MYIVLDALHFMDPCYLLVYRPGLLPGEDLILVYDDEFDRFVHVVLVDDLVLIRWYRKEGRTEAHGQVIRLHQVLVVLLRQTKRKTKLVTKK